MADETKTSETTTDYDVNVEVKEWLTQGIAILCDANDEDVTLKAVCGDRSATFLAELKDPRHKAILIGKEGRTIKAFRQILRGMGGAYKRYYDLALAEDDRKPKPPAKG